MTTPHPIAEGIWLWPSDPDPDRVQSAVGLIIGQRETVLVDAGHSPELGHAISRWLAASGFPPVKRILLTHHHWDHTYGACAFEAEVIAHTRCRAALEIEAQRPWSVAYLEAERARTPKLAPSFGARLRAISDWTSFRIVLPCRVFETRLDLELEGRRIELRHVGGRHADDSIVVGIPDAGVLFLGDCHYPPPYHLRSPEDRTDSSLLASLVSETYGLYVEGHAPPATREEVRAWLAQNR